MALADVLVDTSAWVDFFTRPASETAGVVDSVLKTGRACVTGAVVAELVRGTRTAHERALLLNTLRPLPVLETTQESWVLAGTLAASLDQRGVAIPLTDLLIAAVAHLNNRSIYTTDRHFTRIPHVQLYHPLRNTP